MAEILSVRDLRVNFETYSGRVAAVRGASFDIEEGQVTAIVGESGCGKSVTAKSVLGLVRAPGVVEPGSQILFRGQNVLEFSEREWRNFRGKHCSIVFQDALAALNPTLTIGKQITEKILVHRKVSRAQAWEEATEMLELVGIPNAALRMKQYPHEFSGGMRQRVMIAIALTLHPSILIADEPTTALDVTVQADIVDMLKEVQREMGMSVVLITHDLGIVANFASRIVVMYAGEVVESGSARQIFYECAHPYTAALLAAVPRLDVRREARLETIEGAPPDMRKPIEGCPFFARCKKRCAVCEHEPAPLREVSAGHSVRCWLGCEEARDEQ